MVPTQWSTLNVDHNKCGPLLLKNNGPHKWSPVAPLSVSGVLSAVFIATSSFIPTSSNLHRDLHRYIVIYIVTS